MNNNNNKTKKEFEKSLFILLENKNYHDITINEICALANKTKMTFYHYFKDKESLLATAFVNLINNEYNEEYEKIIKKETNLEEIEYLSTVAIYELVAKHYNQIRNLSYKGDTFYLEIFKNALFNNYSKYLSNLIDNSGYDIPIDYVSIIFFEGLYGSCLYYAEQLKISKNKKKTKEKNKMLCRFLAKTIMSITKIDYSDIYNFDSKNQ